MSEFRLEHGPIVLRDRRLEDFDVYLRWRRPDAEWKLWDAPWDLPDPLLEDQRETWVQQAQARALQTPRRSLELETREGAHIGFVNAYWTEGWEDRAQDWLSLGLVICEGAYWSRGYGRAALEAWANHLFSSPEVGRLAYATWSGNDRMVRLGLSLGFVEEARFRRARAVRGERYDAVRFGLLREEWMAQPWARSAGTTTGLERGDS